MNKSVKKFFLFSILVTSLGFANVNAYEVHKDVSGHQEHQACHWPVIKHIWDFFGWCPEHEINSSKETSEKTLDEKTKENKKEIKNEMKKAENSVEQNLKKTEDFIESSVEKTGKLIKESTGNLIGQTSKEAEKSSDDLAKKIDQPINK
jgi:hypothetical protein